MAIYDLMSIFPREEADKRLLSNALTLREKKKKNCCIFNNNTN